MDEKNIQDELERLEKELRDLKTIQGVIPTMNGYTYNYVHSGSGQQQVNVLLEVEYADGEGEIYSGCMNTMLLAPLEIIGNKQRFFYRILFDNTISTFYANRPILSVKKI